MMQLPRRLLTRPWPSRSGGRQRPVPSAEISDGRSRRGRSIGGLACRRPRRRQAPLSITGSRGSAGTGGSATRTEAPAVAEAALADAEIAEVTDEAAADAHDEAVLDIIAMEMGAPDPFDVDEIGGI